jgi:hypothetical protein
MGIDFTVCFSWTSTEKLGLSLESSKSKLPRKHALLSSPCAFLLMASGQVKDSIPQDEQGFMKISGPASDTAQKEHESGTSASIESFYVFHDPVIAVDPLIHVTDPC